MELNKEIKIYLDYLGELKISINQSEFKNQIESHPDFPSLLAFSDALSFFSIPNIAIKVPISNISELPNIFLAILSDNYGVEYISLIRLMGEEYYCTKLSGNEEKVSIKELENIWTGIVLIADRQDADFEYSNLKEKNLIFYKSNILIILINIVIFLLTGNFPIVFLSFILVLGIYLSIEAIKVELGIGSIVSNQLCQVTENSDCSQIINSQSGIIGSLKLTDLSFCFFSCQLLLIITGSKYIDSFYSMLMILLTVAVPFSIYSIYIQAKVEKKWCPICLGILALIYIELIYILVVFEKPLERFEISIHYFAIIFTIVSFTIISYSFAKRFFVKYRKTIDEYVSNLKYIRTYNLFKTALLSQEIQSNNYSTDGLRLGNQNAALMISAIITPFCSYCKDTYESIYHIYKNYPNSVNINLRFILSGKDKLSEEIYIQLYRIYMEDGEKSFAMALNNWFFMNNIELWLNKYKKEAKNRTEIINYLITDNYESKNNGIYFTPFISINRYSYPQKLNTKYIKYFVADMLDDKEFLIHNNILNE